MATFFHHNSLLPELVAKEFIKISSLYDIFGIFISNKENNQRVKHYSS